MTVSVDGDFARFGEKSSAINKINTVEVRKRRPHGKGGAILGWIVGVFFLLAGFGATMAGQGGGVVMLLIGAFFCAVGWRSWRRSKVVEFSLYLMTSSSEAQAFTTRDESEVLSLRAQIESAMARRS